MTNDAVALDLDGPIATITLDRPERRNALTHEVAEGVSEALATIGTSDARCVVVRGAGPAFSAGGDIKAMRERLDAEGIALHETVDGIVERTGRAIRDLVECDLPTVAAVDGVAFGAGANLAIAADVVLASDEAAISFGFRQVGLAVDAGTSYLLPRLVGENVAKELVFTGEIVGAERAERLGLFNHVYPADEFDERAGELIDAIAAGPTVGLAASKRCIANGLDVDLGTAIRNEADAQAAVFETRDHREGVEAFLERRAPEFEGR